MEGLESSPIGKIILIDPGHGGPDGGAGDKVLWKRILP